MGQIQLNGDKERMLYGVHILWMADTGKYEFRRNFEKDIIAEVIPDGDTKTELKLVATKVESVYHLAVDNLNEILEGLPHEQKGARRIK